MARILLVLALVAMLLVSSVSAQNTVAHSKNKKPKCKARQIYSTDLKKCICNFNAGFGRLVTPPQARFSNRNRPVNGCVVCANFGLVADPSGDCVENISPTSGRRLFSDPEW